MSNILPQTITSDQPTIVSRTIKDPMIVITDEIEALLDAQWIDQLTYDDLMRRFCRQATRSMITATPDEHRKFVLNWAREVGLLWGAK